MSCGFGGRRVDMKAVIAEWVGRGCIVGCC